MMCLQDNPLNSKNKACILFDNGLELTLVSKHFTIKINLSFEKVSYRFLVLEDRPQPTSLVIMVESILYLKSTLTMRL